MQSAIKHLSVKGTQFPTLFKNVDVVNAWEGSIKEIPTPNIYCKIVIYGKKNHLIVLVA